MKNRVGHPAGDLGIDRRRAAQTRYSRDAAHQRRSGAMIARSGNPSMRCQWTDRAECRPPPAPVLTLSRDA
jgi:hypothetical protein